MLRAETELVEKLSQAVINTRNALACMHNAGGAQTIPTLAQPVSKMGLSAVTAMATRPAPSRPRSRAVGLSPLPSPPRTAPASHGKRGWPLPVVEDSLPSAPLWACSPSTGWHAHEQLAHQRPPTQSVTSGRASPSVWPTCSSHPDPEEKGAAQQGAMSTTRVPVEASFKLVDSYSRQLPWSPMRYEANRSRWVASVVPLEAAKASVPHRYERVRRMRNAKSLPSLLAATYVKNPRAFDPNEWGGYVR